MTAFDQKFIENPEFLKWVFNANPANEYYWGQYILEHPEEKAGIFDLKNHLSELRFSNDVLSTYEKEEIVTRITKIINLDTKVSRHRTILRYFMRYAAAVIVFAAIGGFLLYLNRDKESLYQLQPNQMARIPSITQGPLLITSSGKNVELKKSSSTVDYSRNGAVVLNNDSVIPAANEVVDAPNQLIIPYGNQSRVVLSDNTVVWLNAGSRLVYPTLFKGKTREVLLYGEAYFEVAKNPGKPFIVKTSDLEIKVLGTKFDVSAYDEDNVIQTVLKEGSVSIRRNGANFFEKDIVIKPNQLASFDKTNSDLKIHEVDADYYTLWTEGLMSFDEIDFSRVIKKVERYYNISINFSDPKTENMRISGKLDLKQGRNEMMEYLEKVSLSKFEQINENQYIIK